ncbi:MAG: hypothetical protein NTX61_15540 [Bacteroidetes bacterium]|nr:hypothetical protein [Bacteroidota bacterium]
MRIMVRFEPKKIVSDVWFVVDHERFRKQRVISVTLIPVSITGTPLLTEVFLPEIFLQ